MNVPKKKDYLLAANVLVIFVCKHLVAFWLEDIQTWQRSLENNSLLSEPDKMAVNYRNNSRLVAFYMIS